MPSLYAKWFETPATVSSKFANWFELVNASPRLTREPLQVEHVLDSLSHHNRGTRQRTLVDLQVLTRTQMGDTAQSYKAFTW